MDLNCASLVGARLLFTDRNVCSIWAQDDSEQPSKQASAHASGGGNDSKKQHSARRNHKSKVTTTDNFNPDDDYNASMVRSVAEDDILLVDKVLPFNESDQISFLRPTFGFLSRAHLTCGVAPGVSAAQTGQDMIDMVRKESDSLQRNTPLLESANQRTVMKFFGDGQCMVYLKEPIPIDTIFSGCFH